MDLLLDFMMKIIQFLFLPHILSDLEKREWQITLLLFTMEKSCYGNKDELKKLRYMYFINEEVNNIDEEAIVGRKIHAFWAGVTC